jgi:uncharacterized iron-regulated membrane protein
MRDTFRQSMAWLHTWAGLVVGWVLFVIFVAGTVACFDKELDYWMRPALHHLAPAPVSMDAALHTLREMAPHAETVFVRPPSARDPSIHGFVFEPGKPYIDVALDPHNGRLIPATAGGTFFFTLHYNLQAGDIGMYLVGLAGMLMLIALITGVVIHRRIFKDFFVFRPRRGGQRAWLDGHNLTGVLGLPFHLMIAYTGVAILVFSYMTAGVRIGYHGDFAQFYEELQGNAAPVAQHEPLARLASLDTMLADAVRRMHGPALYMEVQNIHDASATVSVLESGDNDVMGGRRSFNYRGADGAFIGESKGPDTAYRVYAFLSGLHRVQFGSAALRWLYFLLGGAGCVMLACGMQVWVAKRTGQTTASDASLGHRVVRALNVGVVGGMPLASVAMLWIDRLLPPSLASRDQWEICGFFAIWLLSACWGMLRLKRHAWRELFAATSALLLALPLMNAIASVRSSLLYSVADHDYVLVGVDATAFALGLGFAWLAWKCRGDSATKPIARNRTLQTRVDEAMP